MIEENAIVTKIENQHVWVQGQQNNACGGCAQKSSCSTSVLSQWMPQKNLEVVSDFQLNVGDKVTIGIDEKLLLQASLLLYLFPLIVMFIAAAIADYLTTNQLYIAGSSVSALLLSLSFIHKLQYLWVVSYGVKPVVIKKAT